MHVLAAKAARARAHKVDMKQTAGEHEPVHLWPHLGVCSQAALQSGGQCFTVHINADEHQLLPPVPVLPLKVLQQQHPAALRLRLRCIGEEISSL